MAALLFFCLPLLFIVHILSSKNRADRFLAYCIGIIEGIVLLFIFSWFGIIFDPSIADFSQYWLTYTIVHTLLPSFFCMLLYAVISFSYSSKVIILCPSAVFGLFTLYLYQYILAYSSSIHMLPIIFHIIIYSSAVFIFDALVTVLVNRTEFRLLGFLSSVVIFCFTLFIGCYAYTLWYFNTNLFFSYLVFTLLLLIAYGIQFYSKKLISVEKALPDAFRLHSVSK